MPHIFPPQHHESLTKAVETLQKGGVVAFATETVYGLGANALNGEAVARIYAAKGRPSFNPLIVHVADKQDCAHYAEITPLAAQLLAAFAPGALTLVLNRKADCPLSSLVSAGLNTVALRVPAHPVAQNLLKAAGLPIAAPSANRSGRISPTKAKHVAEEFADMPELMIMDGGNAPIGLESTVVDARGHAPVLLRPGAITPEMLEQATGIACLLPDAAPEVFHSPGQMQSHYAPHRPVRLNITHAQIGEALLGFGHMPKATLNLSPTGDLVEAAAKLFDYLRELDREPFTAIAVAPIPHEGIGIAINDRLHRAAAPR